jgi:hypothetical protein
MNKFIQVFGLIFLLSVTGIFGATPTSAAVVTVSDEASLAQAIVNANAAPELDIIELTADINLNTTTPYVYNGNNGLPVITTPLVIRGNGHTIRRTSATLFRLLAVNSTQLWLEDLTLAGGNAGTNYGGAIYMSSLTGLSLVNVIVGGSTENANTAQLRGGGIFGRGQISIINSDISYNSATPNNNHTYGGGFWIYGTTSSVVIVDSYIHHNYVTGYSSYSGSGGGGVVSGGDLIILNSTFSQNVASGRSAGSAGLQYAGQGNVTISGSIFDGNRTENVVTAASGGGLVIGGDDDISPLPSVHISNSQFSNNNIEAGDWSASGGGLLLQHTIATIENSSFFNNTVTLNNEHSARGAGLRVTGGELLLKNSTVTDNTVWIKRIIAHSAGDEGGGTGIFVDGVNITATIENVTVSDNFLRTPSSRSFIGGAVAVKGYITLRNVTIANNTTQMGSIYDNQITSSGLWFVGGHNNEIRVANTIVTNNVNVIAGVTYSSSCFIEPGSPAAVVFLNSYNQIEPDGYCENYGGASDVLTPAVLEPLADNGGFTQTHAINTTPPINAGNPAIPGSSPTACPATDQRGALRDAQCDIGAYEFGATVPSFANPVGIADIYSTITGASFFDLVGQNDYDPEGGSLIFYLESLPVNGTVTMLPTGFFRYIPATNVTGNEFFTYRVCNVHGRCSELTTVIIQVSNFVDIPEAPTNLVSTDITPYTINISWEDNSTDETHYYVERSSDGGIRWQPLANLAPNTTSYNDDDLVCGKEYQYRVIGYRSTDQKFSLESNILGTSTSTCPPPANLVATAVSYNSILLTWEDVVTDETNYIVERSSDGGVSWTTLTISANSTSFAQNALLCETEYHYRVRTYRAIPLTYSEYTPIVSAITNTCPPPPATPTNLTGTAIGWNSIQLTWDDNAIDETRYYLEYSTSGGSTWSNLVNLGANSVTYTHTGLVCNSEYQYRLRAYRTEQNAYSEYSNIAITITGACPPPPAAPTNLVAVAVAWNRIDLTWQDNATDETRYDLEISTNSGTSWAYLINIATNSVAYSSSNLTCTTEYQYRVRAYRTDQNMYSDYSNIAIATTLPCPPPPAIPTNVVATATGLNSIQLTWQDNATDETRYEVFRSNDNGTTWQFRGITNANATTYTDSGLRCSTEYQYRLRAYRSNPFAYSDFSSIAVATTYTCPPFSPPTNLRFDPDFGIIYLRWEDNAIDESYYYIEESRNGGTSWTQLAQVSTNTTSYYMFYNCVNVYQYRVRAARYSPVEYSDYSNIAIGNLVCEVASNIVATATGPTSISLTWTDSVSDETAFIIKRRHNSTITEVATVPANTTEYTDNNLTCGEEYRYEVKAYREGDEAYSFFRLSNYATTHLCPQPPAPPTSLVTTANSPYTIDLTWVDNATSETEYRIEQRDNGVTWVETAQIPADSTSYSDTGLACGTSHNYRVRAYDAVHNQYSNYSNISTISAMACQPPAAPTSLIVSAQNSSEILLTWFDNATNETAYDVQRSTNGTVWYTVGSLSANSTSFTDTSLLCGATYYYRVRAYNSSDNLYSGYSNMSLDTTEACGTINCSLAEFDTGINSQPNVGSSYQLGPVYLSGDGSRVAMNYGLPSSGLRVYDVVTETLIDEIAGASSGDIDGDGSRVVFRSDQDYTGSNPLGNSQIFLWDNGAITQLTQATNVTPHSPQISDDGNTIVFGANGDLFADTAASAFTYYIWTQADGLSKLLPQAADLPSSGRSIVISGDGHTVAFQHDGDLTNPVLSETQIYLWDAVNGVQRMISLVDAAAQPLDIMPYSFAINGDGTRITFTASNNFVGQNADGYTELYVWDAATGLSQRTYDTLGSSGTWGTSIDGTGNRILFFSGANLTGQNADGNGDGFVYDMGDGYYQVTQTAYLGWPTFGTALSSDGTHIAILAPNIPLNKIQAETDPDNSLYPHIRLFISNCDAPLGNSQLTTPTNLNVDSVTGTTVQLEWNDTNTTETGFRVERSLNGGTTWTEIAQMAANSTIYSDSAGLACDTSYAYRVRAYRTGNNSYSAYSNTVEALTAPCTPSALAVVSVITTSVSIEWTDNASTETDYRVERSANGGSTWQEIVQIAADSIGFTNNNLTCNTTYVYRIRAYRSTDDTYSGYSASVNALTALCPLAAPTALATNSVTGNTIGLQWVDNDTTETGYRVERSPDGGSTWTEIASLTASSSSYTDSSVDIHCETTYHYQVRAYRDTDTSYSNYSNILSILTVPCQPSILVTEITANSVEIIWNDLATETQYRVERSLDAGATWVEIAQLAQNSTTFTDTSLTCETSYRYRIRAYRSTDALYSTYSNVVFPATSDCPLVAPTGLTVTGTTATTISLQWSESNSSETSVLVERSDDGIAWVQIAELDANTTSHSDVSLTCETIYDYRVRVYRSVDDTYSAYSNTISPMTGICSVPNPPTQLQLTGIDIRSVDLLWTDNGFSATQYIVERSSNNGASWQAYPALGNDVTVFTANNLTCQTNYQFRVRGLRLLDSQYTAYSEIVSGVTLPCPPLATPAAPIVTAIEAISVSLSFTSDSSGEVDQWQLERATGGSWQLIATLPVTITTYHDTNRACATPYSYRLRAYRAEDAALSAYSAESPVMTASCEAPVQNTVGLYKNGMWIFTDTNESGMPDTQFRFGPQEAGWYPLIGDWDGDGVDGIGIYRNGLFLLRDTTDGGVHDTRFYLGYHEAGWQPIVGDWNGDGVDTVGVYKAGAFMLTDSLTSLTIDYRFSLNAGGANWVAITGDWDGNGADSVGLYLNGTFMLTNHLGASVAPYRFPFGPTQAGWYPIAGDWNADGTDSIGIYSQSIWRLRNANDAGSVDVGFNFGAREADWIPLASYRGGAAPLLALAQAANINLEALVEPTIELTIAPTEPPVVVITPEATIEATAEGTVIPTETPVPVEPTTVPLEPTALPSATPLPEPTASEPEVTEEATAP